MRVVYASFTRSPGFFTENLHVRPYRRDMDKSLLTRIAGMADMLPGFTLLLGFAAVLAIVRALVAARMFPAIGATIAQALGFPG